MKRNPFPPLKSAHAAEPVCARFHAQDMAGAHMSEHSRVCGQTAALFQLPVLDSIIMQQALLQNEYGNWIYPMVQQAYSNPALGTAKQASAPANGNRRSNKACALAYNVSVPRCKTPVHAD
jgi:hypothetical protein